MTLAKKFGLTLCAGKFFSAFSRRLGRSSHAFSLLIVLSSWAVNAQELEITPAEQVEVVGLWLEGQHRTNPDWLKTYLDLKFPRHMTHVDLDAIRTKLLTTEVFTEVHTSFVDAPGKNEKLLKITLLEKWTTIPVLRGAYGGGTPLTVVGVYDTHSLGRLWTFGAEGQRYGTAPWGGVVWARAPRLLQGYHEQGVEFWRQFRVRSIYNDDDKKIGEIRADSSMTRLFFMAPLSFISFNWKLGLDVRYRQEAPSSYTPEDKRLSREEAQPPGIRISDQHARQLSPLVRIVYDNMEVDNLSMKGLRILNVAGPLIEKSEIHSRWESEMFWFLLTPKRDFNFGIHALAGQTTSNSLDNQYFLGGFESVRGLPDGVMYGNRAAFANIELRHMSLQKKYAWVQTSVFTDVGGAGPDWVDVRDHVRSSAGLGFRIAVPQVYRLMVRIDYAWSLDHPGMSGVSIGMNQFFQPYKPL